MRFFLFLPAFAIHVTAAFVIRDSRGISFLPYSKTETILRSVASACHSRSSPTTTALLAERRNGDTRGAALLLEDVTVFRGPAAILKDLSWRVEPKTKWGLVGANGAGKSTLLKAIVGELEYEGNILVQNLDDIGYLQQTAVAGSTRSVYEEACSGMKIINQAKEAMEQAAREGNEEALMRATMQFEANDGFKQEQKVDNVLKGLGFRDYHSTRCHELSGGWQMRVAFARQLLSDTKLSLLDEPSNHLDASARTWLASYLAKYRGEGALVLVTHDVELLQAVDHIAEIIPGSAGLQIYKSCTYDQYLEQKQDRAAAALMAFERNKEEAEKLQSFVDRFGASATKAASAQSRVKQIERMRRQGLLDAPPEAIVAERFRPIMKLPKPPKAFGNVLLSLHDADLGYKVDQPLVKGVSIEICKGMKILIRGPNGSGKSTMLHSIRGSLPLLSGARHENPKLSLGMFTQDLAQELDPMAIALETVTSYAREFNAASVSDQQARGALGRLGLTGDKPLRRLADLSGGEKARVALTMFALRASNVYILDEGTYKVVATCAMLLTLVCTASNHLDSECVEALSQALSEWDPDEDGAIVVVSHDRKFCDAIEFTHVATVKAGKLTMEQRSVRDSDWIVDGLSSEAKVEEVNYSTTKMSQPKSSLNEKQRKQAYNAPKRIAKLEKLVEEAEAKIAQLDSQMISVGNDVGRLLDLSKEKDSIQAKVDAYMEEWDELEALVLDHQNLLGR